MWFKCKAKTSTKPVEDGPYRNPPPPEPKMESKAERDARMKLEKNDRNTLVVLALGFFPSVGALAIGGMWNNMGDPMHTATIMALVAMTISSVIACSIKYDW